MSFVIKSDNEPHEMFLQALLTISVHIGLLLSKYLNITKTKTISVDRRWEKKISGIEKSPLILFSKAQQIWVNAILYFFSPRR